MLLEAHHTRPRYVDRMGGRKTNERPWKQPAASDGRADQQRGKSWQYWQGAWPSPKKEKGELPLRYDQIQVAASSASGSEETRILGLTGTGPGGQPAVQLQGEQLRRQVQKALTTSKRCDTKIRKLLETKETRKIQWQAWRDRMKASFLKQQQQFEKDQEDLDAEVASLQAQGEEAAQSMQQLVLHGPQAMETENNGEKPPDTGAWEELIRQEGPDPPNLDFMKQAYALAQMAQQRLLSGCGPPPGQMGLGVMPPAWMEQAVGCPPIPHFGHPPGLVYGTGQTIPRREETGRPTAGPETTPPPVVNPGEAYSTADVGNVRAGPYNRSPLAGGLGAEQRMPPAAHTTLDTGAPMEAGARTHGAMAEPSRAPLIGNPHPPPVPVEVKVSLDGQAPSPVAEMLRTRRQEARKAREPFSREDAGEPPEGGEAQDRPPERPQFVEDDLDEELATAGLGASPGLSRLE